MKKIHYLLKFGQLGNQMCILAHLLAFAKEYGYQVIFPDSRELSSILKPNTSELPCLVFRNVSIFHRLISLIKNVRLFGGDNVKKLNGTLLIYGPYNVDKQVPFIGSQTILLNNWLFRYYSGVVKHQNYIRNYLAFKTSLTEKSEVFIKRIRSDNPSKYLIGIHIRKGDYATWNDGRYYYSDSQYYTKIKEVAALLPGSIFIISSNEPIELDNHAGFEILYCHGTAIEDLHILSLCDYIMGPPSTFSGWAAFIGDIPLYFLENINAITKMNFFVRYYL